MISFSKNWNAIILAGFLTLVQILFIKELFQWMLCVIFGTEVSELTFGIFYLSHYFEPNPNTLMPVLFLLYLAPLLYLVFSIELASLFLKKFPQGMIRFSILIFILLQIGYLLVKIFYNAVLLILNPGLENDWIAMSIYLGFGDMERFIFAFGIIFLFVFYLNLSTRRVTNYINLGDFYGVIEKPDCFYYRTLLPEKAQM